VSEITTRQVEPRESTRTRGSLKRTHAILVWLPVAVIVVATAVAWHFVSFAFSSAPELNGTILAVMLWGAISMVMHVRATYREDRVFFAGIDWLRKGAWSSEPDPSLGPKAYVQGMLERLGKLGLGHQVYVQSAAMEPEIEALEHYFEQRQELSQYLVGLMVGLGLLGTFIGLLETLIATGDLIGAIANSVGGKPSGGDTSAGMEAQFANIVGGLQKPLAAMGTAFSASLFGLIGSIMLGFQMVVVRKAVATFVDNVREEVLSLAEKSKVNANVEVTERFLATLLADVLEQHRQSETRLSDVARQLSELTPAVVAAARSSEHLAQSVTGQNEALDRTITAVGQVRDVVPLIAELASASSEALRDSAQTRQGVNAIVQHLPDQAIMRTELQVALKAMGDLVREVAETRSSTRDLTAEVRLQGSVVKRLDTALWNAEKSSLRKLMEEAPKERTS
jgi:hypothetical protein